MFEFAYLLVSSLLHEWQVVVVVVFVFLRYDDDDSVDSNKFQEILLNWIEFN